MEGQTEFRAALKKTVVMFNLLTGKNLTELEGEAFINLFDLSEGYLATSIQDGTAMMQVAVDDAGDIKVREVGQEEWRKLADTSPTTTPLVETVANATGATSVTRDSKASGLDGFADYEYIAQPIITSKRDRIPGYAWQIVVLSREKDASDSYVVHFAYQPTQEQFEEHYSKFVARTHYVHVNEWHRGEREWVGITPRYAAGVTQPCKQDHDPRWEQADMAYRVRYYDRETGQLTFKYMPRKPSGNELATYHHLKGFAVVQSKVG